MVSGGDLIQGNIKKLQMIPVVYVWNSLTQVAIFVNPYKTLILFFCVAINDLIREVKKELVNMQRDIFDSTLVWY